VVQKMNDRAADYFKLWSDEESLAATSATATPGVENHVQLRLLYPRPAGGAFKVEAPLLVTLAADGAYGVSLTLLDMVNQKVVGQSVLLAGSSTSPLLSVTLPVASNAAPSRPPSAGPPISADADIGSASEGDSQPGEVTRMNYRLVWWLLAGIFAACILCRVVRLNKAHDKQQG